MLQATNSTSKQLPHVKYFRDSRTSTGMLYQLIISEIKMNEYGWSSYVFDGKTSDLVILQSLIWVRIHPWDQML